jgi:hypothetical protein
MNKTQATMATKKTLTMMPIFPPLVPPPPPPCVFAAPALLVPPVTVGISLQKIVFNNKFEDSNL